MTEQKTKVPLPGLGLVEGTSVTITESLERWTEIRLADGAVLRVKPVVMSVVRIDGRYDPQGNPIYAVTGGQTMVVDSVPEHLRQSVVKDQRTQ